MSVDQDELRAAVAAELARLQSTGEIRFADEFDGERPPVGPKKNAHGWSEFDPATREWRDPTMRQQLYRPDLVRSCPCGQAKYVHVQEFTGQREIEQAKRPVIDQRTGELVQAPYKLAYRNGECLIPEELRLTKEKAAHIRACNEQRAEDLQEAGVLEEVDEQQAERVLRMVRSNGA